MTKYNTGNPVGSSDPRDLHDNAQNADYLENGPADRYPDRLGKLRKSRAGMEKAFDDFLAASGYQFIGEYASGIEVTSYNQVIRDTSGEFWRAAAATDLPYATTGAGMPEGEAFVSVGDAALRQEMASSAPGNGSDLLSHAGTNDTVTAALNKRTIHIGSVAELVGISGLKDGSQYSTSGYREGSTKGGGVYVWRASYDKSAHDGVQIIDPSRIFPVNFDDKAQVSSWLSAGTGSGCFVKKWSPALSAYEAGVTDVASTSDTLLVSALLQSLCVNR